MDCQRIFVMFLSSKTLSLVVFCRLISGSDGSIERCSDSSSPTKCYFQPSNQLPMNWFRAWQLCNENNATLPVIRNQEDQTQLMEYMKTNLPTNEVWTAANLISSDKWKWVDGQELKHQEDVRVNGSRDYNTAALLRDDQKYYDAFPHYENCYICQYSREICPSNVFVVLKSSTCYTLNYSSELLTFYRARNRCLEGGGDLAVIDNDQTIISLKNLTLQFVQNRGCWIGLLKRWFIWNTTGAVENKEEDVKFTKWGIQGQGTYGNINCMHINASNNYDWFQTDCLREKQVLCQKAFAVAATSPPDNDLIAGSVPGGNGVGGEGGSISKETLLIVVGVGAFIIVVSVIVIIVAVIFIRKQPKGRRVVKTTRLRESSARNKNGDKPPVKSTIPKTADEIQGHYAAIPLATNVDNCQGEDHNDQSTGIVYAAIDFESHLDADRMDNKDDKSNEKQQKRTSIGALGDTTYAVVSAPRSHTTADHGDGKNFDAVMKTGPLGDIYALPTVQLHEPHVNHTPKGIVYANLN